MREASAAATTSRRGSARLLKSAQARGLGLENQPEVGLARSGGWQTRTGDDGGRHGPQQSADVGGAAEGVGRRSAEQGRPGGLVKAAWRAIRLIGSGGAFTWKVNLKPWAQDLSRYTFVAKGFPWAQRMGPLAYIALEPEG